MTASTSTDDPVDDPSIDPDPPIADLATATPGGRPTQRIQLLWTLLVAGILGLFGIAYATPRWTGADFWMYAVMSTRKLTFFYWGQNRLANVVPALAFPVQDPFTNAYVQMLINGAALVAALAIAQRAMFRADPVLDLADPVEPAAPSGPLPSSTHPAAQPLALLVAFLGLTAVTHREVLYTFGYEQPYGVSLMLYLAGSALVLSRRHAIVRLLGVPLVVASLAMSPTTAVFGGLVVPMAVALRRWKALPWFAAANVVALGISVEASQTFGLQAASELYTKFEPDGATKKWRTVASHLWQTFHHVPLVVATVVSGVVIVLSWRRLARATRTLVLLAPPFALVWTLAFTLNAWVRTNALSYRYFIPVYLAVFVAILVAVTSIGEQVLDRFHGLPAMVPSVIAFGLTALLVATIVIWKPIDEYTSMQTVSAPVAYARDHHIRFVGGTYWTTWPAVLALDDSGHEVFGFAERGQAMAYEINVAARSLIDARQPVRIMCIDLAEEWCLNAFSSTTGIGWTTDRHVHDGPLVLDVVPTT